MTTHLRRTFVATLLALSFVSVGVIARQGAAGQGASANQPAPSPRPEVKALTDAMAITDMSARVTALEKIRTDFPEASNMATVDAQLLINLVNNFPERIEPITAAFERIVGRIAPEATVDARLNGVIGPIGTLTGKKLLLDRSEALLKEGLAGIDSGKYAEQLKDAAKRANRPEPTQQQIDSQSNTLRGRVYEPLARVYVAKGDTAKAEAAYKEAVKANPAFGPAMTALVDIYSTKGDWASAESLLKDAIGVSNTPAIAARPQQALADLYMKKGDDAKAEGILNEIVKSNATLATALTPLARLEAKRGDNAKALDHYMTASLSSTLKPEDAATMKSLFAKANNGDASGLVKALDKAYLDKFPNPVTPEHYTPTAARTKKLVLLELFTGSGCPPCVASDLAMEAVMERYKDHIITIAWHEHIPAPDPMVAVNNNDRRLYYSVSGVPTFEIDGAMVANAAGSNPGGGARTNTANVYNNYKSSIDKALEMPARAELDVKATGEGDTVSVTVNVTKLPADAKDLRLHVVLVEKELRFTGENGIRFHPMAVRSNVGEKGAGIPITATGSSKHTFSLNQIRDEITKSLAADIARRRQSSPTGTFAAEGNAYTEIDTSELMVVAFIQEGPYRAPKAVTPPAPQQAPQGPQGTSAAAIQTPPPPAPAGPPTASADMALTNILNAAKADVVFAGASKPKGGK